MGVPKQNTPFMCVCITPLQQPKVLTQPSPFTACEITYLTTFPTRSVTFTKPGVSLFDACTLQDCENVKFSDILTDQLRCQQNKNQTLHMALKKMWRYTMSVFHSCRRWRSLKAVRNLSVSSLRELVLFCTDAKYVTDKESLYSCA